VKNLTVLWIACRYDRDPADVVHYITRRALDLRPTVLLVDEAAHFQPHLHTVPGYHVRPSPSREVAVLVRDGVEAGSAERVVLSRLGIPRRGGRQPDALRLPVAGSVLYATHLPSGVAGAGRLRWTKQGRVWRDAACQLARQSGRHGQTPVVVVADWNVNARRRWTRRLLRRLFPGARLVAPKGWTHRGHGPGRVIDFAMVRHGQGHAQVFRNPTSDHRAVLLTLKVDA